MVTCMNQRALHVDAVWNVASECTAKRRPLPSCAQTVMWKRKLLVCVALALGASRAVLSTESCVQIASVIWKSVYQVYMGSVKSARAILAVNCGVWAVALVDLVNNAFLARMRKKLKIKNLPMPKRHKKRPSRTIKHCRHAEVSGADGKAKAVQSAGYVRHAMHAAYAQGSHHNRAMDSARLA